MSLYLVYMVEFQTRFYLIKGFPASKKIFLKYQSVEQLQ